MTWRRFVIGMLVPYSIGRMFIDVQHRFDRGTTEFGLQTQVMLVTGYTLRSEFVSIRKLLRPAGLR